jgi:tetratricopeptide (TPR) repeat protein
LLTAGIREEGVRELREAIGGDSKARYLLGLELFGEGQWLESIDQLKAFVQTSRSPVPLVPHWLEPTKPELIKAQTIIGRAYMNLQQWSRAADEARAVLTLDAASDDAYGLLADASFAQSKFEDAVGYYTHYLQLRPNELDALARLGMAQAAVNKPADALATFSRAVEIDPTSADAQRNLATALFDAHEIDKAAPHAREAVRLRPADPMAHALLGRTLAAQRAFDEAIVEFRRALQLDPNDAESRDEVTRITRLKSR